MEVRYQPGDGVLVARGDRWLLLGTPPGTAPAGLLDQLWDDLAQPSARSLAEATVARSLPGIALAWLDGATGDHLAVPGATSTRHGDRWELRVGGSSGPATLRVVEGVVAAGAVEVIGSVPVCPVPDTSRGAVIDGIPPAILASTGPAVPLVPATPSATVRRDATADPDHDQHTVARAADPRGGHLEQHTSDTVLAVTCPRGHLTDPLAPACRGCGAAVPDQEPQRVLRPPLGVLRLPDGGLVPLDRPVVMGRRPAAAGPGDRPHLVRLPQDSTYLSRAHARIDLDGWHVTVRDLGSRGGTTLFSPGRDPEKIRAHEPHLLEDGTVVDLAGVWQVGFSTAVPGTGEGG